MFLRKKTKPSSPPPPKSSSKLVSPTRAVESTPTPTNDAPPPLFARFATQGQSGFGSEPSNKPAVSGPMSLVSRKESVAVSAGNTERKAADTSRTRIQNEKPLPPPIISPEREVADMLSSRPSQSSLPLNRRTSSTPRTASANGVDSFLSESPAVRRISTNHSVMPTSPPSPHPSMVQPVQAQAITRGADTASPQTLSSTRKSSPQDLRRKDSDPRASYSGHNDAHQDNLVSSRPTSNKSYAPVDPHSSYRFASSISPSSKPPSSFNNSSNNSYGSPYSGKNDSFYSLPQANGSTASSWNPSNAYISPNLNHNSLNPYTDLLNSNTTFNMGISHSTATDPGSGPFPSHASTTFKGMAAAAPAFSSGTGAGTGLGRRMSGVNVISANNLNNASMRSKGPLIFAAMTTVDVDPGSTITTPIIANPKPTTPTRTSNSTRRQSYQATSASAYPSPPAEYPPPLSPSSHSTTTNKRFSSFSPPSSPSAALTASMPPTASSNGNTNTNTLKRQSRRLSLTQSVVAKPQPPLPPSSSPVPDSFGPSLSSNMNSSGPAPNSDTHTHISANANTQTLKDSRRRSVIQKEKGNPMAQQQYPGNGYTNGSLKQTMSPSSPTAVPLSSPPPVLSSPSHHRTLTKPRHSQQQRPTPPVSPEQPPRSRMSLSDPSTPNHSPPRPTSTAAPNLNFRYSAGAGPIITPQEFEQSYRRVAIPLDEDPFARSGGVRMLSPLSQDDASLPLPLEEKALPSPDSDPAAPREERPVPTPTQAHVAALHEKQLPMSQDTSREEGDDSFLGGTGVEDTVDHYHESNFEEARIEGAEATLSSQDLVSEGDLFNDLEKDGDDDDDNDDNVSVPDSGIDTDNANGPTPPLPDSIPVSVPSASQSYQTARTLRRGDPITKPALLSQPLPIHKNMPLRADRPAEPFPLVLFISEPSLVRALLGYLSYFDWCNLVNVSKEVKAMFYEGEGDLKWKGKGKGIFRRQIDTSLREALKEEVFERFLRTVGYVRWGMGGEKEPIVLSTHDLHSYMLGVTLPTFEYARIADLVLQQKDIIPTLRDATIAEKAKLMVSATRAYNRVLMRLRAQAERRNVPSSQNHTQTSSNNSPRSNAPSRSSSRAPSPVFSVSHAGHGNGSGPRSVGHGYNGREASSQSSQAAFRSPLFRSNRAPLLRVFVPSPEGDWLSDASVLECEAELKRGNVFEMMRLGDVVWDLAVGEEGNAGRLIWDGSYLIDLDYTYSPIGDLPKYIPGFAFPPSYFHRIIRTGASSSNATSNPVIRLDISPWGPEVAMNLQLLQDRVRTETPQGSYHNVVRWVHRSSFNLRPLINSRPSQSRGGTAVRSGQRIPIPDSSLFIDPGWYGKVVVETEGTNEALADLQDRCGKGAFPPRVGSNVPMNMSVAAKEGKMVYRILRERSRPGEIWIRAVSPKERLI